MWRAGWVVVFGCLLLQVGCNRHNRARIITVDGSSTVYPVTEAVAEEFQSETGNRVLVTVGISGTGGGFKKFIRGEIDIAGASRPILRAEMQEARRNGIDYIELPICFDALTVVVSPANDWCDYLTVEELRAMWDQKSEGRITRWNQIRSGWPNQAFSLFGPGADSGTFDYFTEAINGKAKRCRSDYTASEDDNVLVRGVSGNRYALGFFGYAYYSANAKHLKVVPIQWRHNKVSGPVTPSESAILEGIYNPLSRPLFLYVSHRAVEQRPEVRQFVSFYLDRADVLSRETRYIPLPPAAYELVAQRFQRLQLGTAFGGIPEVGVAIDTILQRQPR